MSKRRKRRGYGAVAKHGGQYSKRSHSRFFDVSVQVNRNIGASTKFQYRAQACVVRRGGRGPKSRYGPASDRRCGSGSGRTPTAAGKKALHRLASAMK